MDSGRTSSGSGNKTLTSQPAITRSNSQPPEVVTASSTEDATTVSWYFSEFSTAGYSSCAKVAGIAEILR